MVGAAAACGGQLELPKCFYYLLRWAMIPKAKLRLLYLRNWTFRSLSGRAPAIKKSISYSVSARHITRRYENSLAFTKVSAHISSPKVRK
jgi:hypothetical protein